MKEVALNLRNTILRAETQLMTLTDYEAGQSPAPDKWCPKEVIGHLIDSATNNHARFIKAQLKDDLIFEGYQHEAWVQLQGYRSAKWMDLVLLWKTYNLHLARVIEQIPDEIAHREVRRHNLHQIAWKPVPEEEPATLAYFMQDYVGHLKHHLKQIPNLPL